MTENKPVPSYAFLQSQCIEIKISIKNEPVRLESPLECYACLGKLRKAYNLPCELKNNTLQEEMAELKKLIANKPYPSERIEKIHQILFHFSGDCQTETRHLEIAEYAYSTEK